jgi:dihydroxyacetone kinase
LEDRLNELDARVGDGDTGSTLPIGAKAILQSIDDLPLADAPDLCQAMSDVLAGSLGGSSGVLLSIFLASIGRAYAQTGAWPKALESGIASLQTYGGAAVGDRTMIDALVPANKALLAGEGLPRAAETARAGAEATAKMDRAGAGRSSYLSALSLTDLPDSGAVAVAEVFAALAAVH